MKTDNEHQKAPLEGDPRGLSPQATRVRAMFSSIAPYYDRLNHLLSLSIDRRWRALTVRRALERLSGDAAAPRRVLDICAGTGDLSIAFARKLPRDAQVIGADYSHAMLVRAGEKFRRVADSARLSALEADALCLPFSDGSFDAASVAFGLRNWVDHNRGLREMARVVRPGGVVAVLEFAPPRAWWLRGFYRFYLRALLPLIGNLLSRSSAYAYLAETIEGFAPSEEVCEWLAQAGLDEVEARPMTGGIAVLYTGVVS